MKIITIRELHARTGHWVREVARQGQIVVTDNGKAVATIVPNIQPAKIPYFARRKRSPKFRKLDDSDKMGKGTDSTVAISQDRDSHL